MPRLLEPLWLVLISFAEKQLAQTIEFLREENRILRGKLPKRITLSAREKNRLMKYGSKLGPAINGLITIVSPRTFSRWMKDQKGPAKTGTPKCAFPYSGRIFGRVLTELRSDPASIYTAGIW